MRFDMLTHIDFKTDKRTAYQLPKAISCPSRSLSRTRPDLPRATAYLLATVYRGADKRSDLGVFDAAELERGPIALAELSHRVPFGFHGNWRPAA